ncbi:MAG: ATP-binding protein [Deltaproteobacteria bacterium]|nr:ATP-binding protein [Deltaproteobacteria bacterium]
MPGHGKTVYMLNFMAEWRARNLGKSLAVDLEAREPIGDGYLARWADVWCREPPEELPDWVRLMVCDEAHEYVGTQAVKYPGMESLASSHRHKPVMLLWGTQRPNQIKRDVWAKAKRVVIFRVIDSSDHRRLLELPGLERKHIDVISRLPPGFAAVWDLHETGIWLPWVPQWES